MWQIGPLKLLTRVLPAPMAGFSDAACRFLAREAGCSLAYTEMLSARALLGGHPPEFATGRIASWDHPLGVQLLGHEPQVVARAASLVVQAGADLIDLNMGCPSPRIVANGEGAALLRDPERAVALVAAVRDAIGPAVPVTVKIRLGWQEGEEIAPNLACRLAAAGAAAVVVHGRYRNQFYRGTADWQAIKRVKEAVQIPVVGNGDVTAPPDAVRLLAVTGCDGLMIGRGAVGNPWLLAAAVALVEHRQELKPPGPRERLRGALRYLELNATLGGSSPADQRRLVAWYLKGLRGAAARRRLVMDNTGREDLKGLVEAWLQEEKEEPAPPTL